MKKWIVWLVWPGLYQQLVELEEDLHEQCVRADEYYDALMQIDNLCRTTDGLADDDPNHEPDDDPAEALLAVLPQLDGADQACLFAQGR